MACYQFPGSGVRGSSHEGDMRHHPLSLAHKFGATIIELALAVAAAWFIAVHLVQ